MTLIGSAFHSGGDELHGIHGMVYICGDGRQREVECRALAAIAGSPDSSAMRFDDRFTDGQAHAAALWLRRKERVEYLVAVALG